jgi:hypothetical protein
MDINPFQFLISRKKTLNQINFFSNFLKEKTFVKNKKEIRNKKQPIAGTQTQQLTADKRKKKSLSSPRSAIHYLETLICSPKSLPPTITSQVSHHSTRLSQNAVEFLFRSSPGRFPVQFRGIGR